MTDKVNASLTGLYPRTFQLITQGSNTVAVYHLGQNTYGHGISNSGSNTIYGNFSPIFTIDPTTNVITKASNYYGQPASNGRSANLDPTGVNAFTMSSDGTTLVTLKIKYILNEKGTDRTFFDETWTYTSSR